MTENRCIEVLKKMKHMFTETCAKIDENTALDMAVETIKEIQSYRAIGTVEELQALKEKEELFDRNIKMFNSVGVKIRNNTIDEMKQKFRADFEEMKANDMEDCVNWADWLDAMAEEMKGVN